MRRIALLSVLTLLILAGCPSATEFVGGTTNDGVGTPSNAVGTSPNNSVSNAGTTTGTATGTGLSVSGKLLPQSGKRLARAAEPDAPFTVVVQSDDTGEVYRAETKPDGSFAVELPADEAGHTMTTTILGPDGRVLGPVLLSAGNGKGTTGMQVDSAASVGTIDLPLNPALQPIFAGADGDAQNRQDADVTTRLNATGAPIGLSSHGKGNDAQTGQTRPGHADKDGDGLIDIFDADADGNGIVNDFEPGGGPVGPPRDFRANFFMNLKIDHDRAGTYYTGSHAAVDERLKTDTVITFEVLTEPGATRQITKAYLLATPGPTYLPICTQLTHAGAAPLWSASQYAFQQRTDRWDAFVVPNALMNAGDSFTVVIEFSDGTSETVSRMINYVFKNIPRLAKYGAPGALHTFDMQDPTVNGRGDHPIPFDGTQDLVLVFSPPTDELGNPLTGMWYQFEVFYEQAGGGQLNGQIDTNATWPTPIPGQDQRRTVYSVSAAQLGALDAAGHYTVQIPKAMFPSTVTLQGGGTASVSAYKIDIAAQCSSGNAAIMLYYAKN